MQKNRLFKKNWKAINLNEFKKFLGVVIFIGVYKSNNENVSQLYSEKDGGPIFTKLMS